MKVKASKCLGLNISLDELLSYNKTCKIDTDSRHHFETYEPILIYVSHPNIKEKFTMQLGIDESGIMYEGDYGCEEKFKEIPIEEGLKILTSLQELFKLRLRLENLLMDNKLDADSVFIDIR